MPNFSGAFDKAISHTMLFEVGGFWKLTADVNAGLITNAAQRKAVGYVNDPLDRGGETKFGIALNANPDVNIKTLTWDDAKQIYFNRYWLTGSCDKMQPRIAALHFDGCVNHGINRANMFLQTAIGVKADGAIGSITLAKLATVNEIDICKKICDLREAFYKQIVARDPKQIRFLNGWLNRINSARTFFLDAKQF